MVLLFIAEVIVSCWYWLSLCALYTLLNVCTLCAAVCSCCTLHMVPMLRESQGKIRKSRGILHFKVRKNEMVKESQGKSKYLGAKVNKDAERILNCFMQTSYNSSRIFLSLCLQIISISTFKFVPPFLFLVRLKVIESQHWYCTWTN